LDLIQNLEDSNIFILFNIEQAEAELEKAKHGHSAKFLKDEKLIMQMK
jgi:hypothetical protein